MNHRFRWALYIPLLLVVSVACSRESAQRVSAETPTATTTPDPSYGPLTTAALRLLGNRNPNDLSGMTAYGKMWSDSSRRVADNDRQELQRGIGTSVKWLEDRGDFLDATGDVKRSMQPLLVFSELEQTDDTAKVRVSFYGERDAIGAKYALALRGRWTVLETLDHFQT